MPLLGLGTFVGALIVLWRVGLVLPRPPPPSLGPLFQSFCDVASDVERVIVVFLSGMSPSTLCGGWPLSHPASCALAPQRGGLFPNRLYVCCHSSRGCTPCCLPPPPCAPAIRGELGGRYNCCPPPPLPLLSVAGWGVSP